MEQIPRQHQRYCVGTIGPARYIATVAKTFPASTETVVHDPKSGRSVTVRGAGALKGRLSLRKDIDLTKPIASQVMKGSKGRKSSSAHAKG